MIKITAMLRSRYSMECKNCLATKKKNPIKKMMIGFLLWWCFVNPWYNENIPTPKAMAIIIHSNNAL
jgi:hypothetical protein